MPKVLQYRWEVGSVYLDNSIDGGAIEYVQFENVYDNPAVVAYIRTRQGSESIQVRINNVTASGCDIFMQEPDYQGHNPESVTYMVMESGVWEHPIMGKMMAGTATVSGSGWDTIYFPESMSSDPCVFATLNTYNNSDFSLAQCQNITRTSFQSRQYDLRTIVPETIGYIVMKRYLGASLGESNTYTIDQCVGGSASASSTYSVSWPASNAFDDNVNSAWHSASLLSGNQWIRYQFTSAKTIRKLRMYPGRDGTPIWRPDRVPGTFTIQGSNTGAFSGEETNIANFVGVPESDVNWTEYEFDNENSFIYYRIYVTATAGGDNYVQIGEAEMLEVSDSIDMIFETGYGDNNGNNFGVDDSPMTINYQETYDPSLTDPLILINAATSNGEQWWPRAANASTSRQSHAVYAEEDQVDDSERDHTNEFLSWFIIQGDYAEESYPYIYRGTYGNVTTNSNYHFKANESYINMYNLGSTATLSVIYLPDHGVSSIWANDDRLYVATNWSGIGYIPISSISGGGLFTDLNMFAYGSDVTSNLTNYINGGGNLLCASTVSGVDFYNVVSGTRYYTYDEDIHKCFQTTSGSLYYEEHISPFEDLSEADLGGTLRDWTYFQYITFSGTPIPDAQVYVTFGPDFSFDLCLANGADLRFISEEGTNLSYNIEAWAPNPVVVVKVPEAGTTGFYMLYGNAEAESQSDPDSTYILYDDFSGGTLDTNKWTKVENGDGTVDIVDDYLRIRDLDNDNTMLYSKDKVRYGLTRTELRYNTAGGTDINQFDGYYGYAGSVSSSPSLRGYVFICMVDGADDDPHSLNMSYFGGSYQKGTKFMTNQWEPATLTAINGYQKSEFDGETLEDTATITASRNNLVFGINNSSNNPDLNVNYVIHEMWPRHYTNPTGSDQIFWNYLRPRLHAVYNPTSNWTAADYVYIDFFGDPLRINDLHVVEGTSVNNNENMLYVATDRGIYVFEEKRGDEANGRKKRYLIE